MASNLQLLLFLCTILAVFAVREPPERADVEVAITEMESASYYTFVTLLQIVQARIPNNATFLMPSDRILAMTPMHENYVSEFVFSHMIPWPLTFSHLRHFPTGSLVPTHYPGRMLRVSHYHRNVYLNNVPIVRPNVCTSGIPIRCHGVNGVLVSPTSSTSPPPHPPSMTPPAAIHPGSPKITAPPPPAPTHHGHPKVAAPPPLSPTAPSTIQGQAPSPTSSTPTRPKSGASDAFSLIAHKSTVVISFAVIMLFEVY